MTEKEKDQKLVADASIALTALYGADRHLDSWIDCYLEKTTEIGLDTRTQLNQKIRLLSVKIDVIKCKIEKINKWE